jgi:HD-GYP domain-containing protein (c-di-GMP phosphodiesterase class II)
MTVRLARQLGCTEEEIIHVRRGALLHDMGKMGIPDEILQKPGPLTDEEWKVMRKHPLYAYQMLSPISYLNQALIIPYYHHERWDGSGYPHGLKEEEIPLFARFFAIVDVWDALSSDRPYRKRMPPKEVVDYLRKEAGKLFDPQIVEKFLHLVETQ